MPDRIVIKNSQDNSVFDTNYNYLRYGSSVTSAVSLSGYSNIPIVFGEQLYNPGARYGLGGFRSAVISGASISNYNDATTNPSLSVDLNAVGGTGTYFDWIIWQPSNGDQGPLLLPGSYTQYRDPTLMNYYVDGVLSGDFKWAGCLVPTGRKDYNANTWIYNVFWEPVIVPVIQYNQNYPTWKTGTYYFPKSDTAVYNWTASGGVTFGSKFTAGTVAYNSNTNYTYLASPRLAPMVAIMSADPQSISMRSTV